MFARMFRASPFGLDFRAVSVWVGVQGLWRRMLHSHSLESLHLTEVLVCRA